uniref:Immunoglobulin domain-containing protein n=1 Tax=Cyprinus carpio TaxID=7962 RepID=A0A8C1YNY9_CYPCA
MASNYFPEIVCILQMLRKSEHSQAYRTRDKRGKKVAQMKFLFILLSTCGLLHRGVFGVEEITMSVTEEDFVTLHTGVKTNHQDRIRWYYNDIRIAQITGNLIKTCKDVQCDEKFKDRLELDNQTGSLSITSIMTADAGHYKLKILGSPSSEKIFNVTVHDQKKTLPVKERETVTLCTGVVNQDDVMIWRFNDTFIAEINGYLNKTCTDVQSKDSDEGFRDRLTLDNQTGSLTITNIRNTDSGLYKLQINSSSCSIIRSFNVIVNETPAMDLIVRNKTAVVGAVILVLIVAVVFAVKRCSTVRRRSDLKKINMNLL